MYYQPHHPVLAFFIRWYQRFIKCFGNLQSLFLFFARLVWGHQFLLYGTIDGGLLGGLEMAGGILLLIGLFSRGVAFLLGLDMLITLATEHIHTFFNLEFLMNPFVLIRVEPFLLFMACLLILIFGPGKLSLDGWIKRLLDRRHLLD